MESISPWLEALFRWVHVVAGVTWIGLLYFFNWINGNVGKQLDAETKQKVLPELLPRTLYFFRWGAAYTWVTGVLLLGLVYYMSGGQVTAPVIFHALVGIRLGGAAQHSARPQAMLLQAAGLQVVAPATSADVKPLLQGVIESERPTFWIDHVLLTEEEWDDSVPVAPFGKASVLRQGKDLTIVGYSIDLVRCLKAADVLAKDGIDAEVIDLRTLAPMDHETVLASVAKTGRLVVSDECSPACSIASEISAFVAEEGFGTLTKPMKRVQFENVPVPISPPLEEFLMPTVEKVVAAAKELVG